MSPPSIALNNLHISRTLKDVAQEPDKSPPFDFYIIKDLFEDKSLNKLRDDINSHVRLSPKDNDLYKFKQSKDLRSEIPERKLTPSIQSFTRTMLEDIKPLLEKESGLVLSDTKFDITASRYDDGNYLLCHNDDMKDPNRQQARALAFVYYLTTRPWTKADGGALILYDHDSSGEPVTVNNLIYPSSNTLVVFKTSPTSWHSVQEVSCRDDCRLSINGWFHLANPAATNCDSDRKIEPNPYEFLQPIPLDDRMTKFFEDCVNGQYMMEKTCYLIRRKFKRNSEINLPHFLVEEKFLEISKALREVTDSEDNLQQVGPYNKRNYKRVKLDRLPKICGDLFDAFRSELFFMLLSRFTGLDLQASHLVHEKQIQESSEDEAEDDDDEDDDDDDDDDDGSTDNGDCDESKSQEGGGAGVEKEDASEESDIETQQSEVPAPTVESETKNTESREQRDEASCKSDSVTAIGKASKRKHDSDPMTRLEFRHLDPGSYTLIHDHAFELGEKSALDVILHFNHDFQVKFEHGGYLSYMDISEDNDPSDTDCELLKVVPKSNCLSLVYRSDENTCRFMKYITRQHKSSFQDLYCVYYERSADIPDGALSKKLKSAEETKESVSDDCR